MLHNKLVVVPIGKAIVNVFCLPKAPYSSFDQ